MARLTESLLTGTIGTPRRDGEAAGIRVGMAVEKVRAGGRPGMPEMVGSQKYL